MHKHFDIAYNKMVGDPIRNLITGDPADRGEGSDTILELWVGPKLFLQFWLVK
jgi:hypothetical protein